MQRETYTDISPEGRVVVNAYVDGQEINARKNNARQYSPNEIYPGGANNTAHAVLEKELAFTFCEKENVYGEVVFSSLSGMLHENREAMMRNIRFAGVVGPKKPETKADEAFALFKSGTDTLPYNGKEEIFPGDLLCWKLPDPQNLPQHTYGTAQDKVLMQMARFDHTDTVLQKTALLSAMSSDNIEEGVRDLDIDMLDDDNEPELQISPLQQEALGFKFGAMLMVARVIAAVSNAAAANQFLTDIGLFAGNTTDRFDDAMRALLDRTYVAPVLNNDIANRYQDRALDLFMNALEGAKMERVRRVWGKALNGAKNGDDLDVLIGDTKIAY